MNYLTPRLTGAFFIGLTLLQQSKKNTMQELINKLMAEGLTEKQALKSIEIVKNFAKDKFPIFAGAIEKVFDKYAPKQDDDFLG
jgi:hypothetical protein